MLWDLARMREHEPEMLGCKKGQPFGSECESRMLPLDLINGYMKNLTSVLAQVKTLVKEVCGEMHNDAMIFWAVCTMALPLWHAEQQLACSRMPHWVADDQTRLPHSSALQAQLRQWLWNRISKSVWTHSISNANK